MTVEHFITRFVYQHKEISLQGIGIIRLDDVVPDPDYLQKHKSIPVSNLSFTYKPGVLTTPAFVKYYSEMRGKIVPLAENDVEAYLGMALQFLNIGNPVEFKGLGTLSKQKDGTFVMTPGHFLLLKDEEIANRFKERVNTDEESGRKNFFGKEEPESSGSAKIIITLVVLVVVAVGGWWLYQSFLKPSTSADSASQVSDTLAVPQQVVPTPAQDTTPKTQAPASAAVTDSLSVRKWKAIFREENDKGRALQILANYQRTATPITMETTDSVTFRYFVVLESSLKDAQRKSDSISRFFARPVKLEPIQ